MHRYIQRGVGETRLVSLMMNSAAAKGPIKFVQGLRACLTRDTAGIPPPRVSLCTYIHAHVHTYMCTLLIRDSAGIPPPRVSLCTYIHHIIT